MTQHPDRHPSTRSLAKEEARTTAQPDHYTPFKELEQQAEIIRLTAERDGAYRERAQLLALLARHYPAVITGAPDVDEPGWTLLVLDLPTGQAAWHQHPRDISFFNHVPDVPADDPRVQWDGHTTEEKYRRIAELAAAR
jgi:hypothetical protein